MDNQKNQNIPPPPGAAPQQPPQQGSVQGTSSTDDSVSNEELIEAIIDEKWNELEKDINTILKWKDSAEKRLVTMEEKITSLKNDFDKLHENILGKVGEYDNHIKDVSAEISSMEKVFAKILPVFTEKVNQLSQVSDEFARAVGKEPSNTAKESRSDE